MNQPAEWEQIFLPVFLMLLMVRITIALPGGMPRMKLRWVSHIVGSTNWADSIFSLLLRATANGGVRPSPTSRSSRYKHRFSMMTTILWHRRVPEHSINGLRPQKLATFCFATQQKLPVFLSESRSERVLASFSLHSLSFYCRKQ